MSQFVLRTEILLFLATLIVLVYHHRRMGCFHVHIVLASDGWPQNGSESSSSDIDTTSFIPGDANCLDLDISEIYPVDNGRATYASSRDNNGVYLLDPEALETLTGHRIIDPQSFSRMERTGFADGATRDIIT